MAVSIGGKSVSLCLLITKVISAILILAVIDASSAKRANRHRFHNKLFHPDAQRNRHRTKRGDCFEDGWDAMTFAGRIANGDSDAILQGTVERLISRDNPSRPYTGDGIYKAEVRVQCIYKGLWNYPNKERVNISGFGSTRYSRDCVRTDVSVGTSYIFLLQDWYGLAVREFNNQLGAVEVNRYTESEVRSFYRCRFPAEMSFSYFDEEDSSYSNEVFSSLDYDSRFFEYFSELGSLWNSGDLCPAYEFFSFLSFPIYGGDYYDYNKDGYIDYCRFLNTASNLENCNRDELKIHEFNDQAGVIETSELTKSAAGSNHPWCRGPRETTVEPSSYSMESSDSTSMDRYSVYQSFGMIYPSSSSSDSSSSSEEECSDCSYSNSPSYYDYSYYDYDRDGGLEFQKPKVRCGIRNLLWFQKYAECEDRNWLWFWMMSILSIPIVAIIICCVCRRWDYLSGLREDYLGRKRSSEYKIPNVQDKNMSLTDWI